MSVVTVGGAITTWEAAIRASTASDRHTIFFGSGSRVARIHKSCPSRETRHIPGPGRSPVTSTSSSVSPAVAAAGARTPCSDGVASRAVCGRAIPQTMTQENTRHIRALRGRQP